MKDKAIKIYKEIGETPLERLDRLRKENPDYADKKLSYAGRLDPMAEGVMLVLVGETNKDRKKYLKYSKEYTFEILFGFSTDTYDLLGLVTARTVLDKMAKNKHVSVSRTVLEEVLDEFRGEIKQEYPPYSSKTVRGKPLFQWAREGQIDNIRIPKNDIVIHGLKVLEERKIIKPDLRKEIITRIMKVKGDFRQKEILNEWDKALKKTKREEFQLFKLNTFVSSGTYIRSLANDIGKELNIPALAFSIKREDVVESEESRMDT